jgi:hypothetical protein
MKFNAIVNPDGTLRVKNRALFDEYLRSLSRDKEYEVEVEVRPKRRYRSVFHNAYYFGVCVQMICDRLREFGHDVDKEMTHEFLKSRFLFNELNDEKTGEVMKIPKKTRDLTTSEFMDYLEQVKQFAAETLDIYIPDPNEQLELL